MMALVLAGFVDGHDVRVIEPGGMAALHSEHFPSADMSSLSTARNPAEPYSETTFVLFVCFCILISFSSSTPPQHRLQMPDFLIYFTRLRDRVGDHFTQKF